MIVPSEFCAHSTCERKVEQGLYCSAHYTRKLRGQDMDTPLRSKPQKECIVSVCTRSGNKGAGYCSAHYQRFKRGRPLDSPIFDRRLPEWPHCTVIGCGRRTESKTGRWSSFCPVHANQVRRGQLPAIRRQQGIYTTCQLPGCEEKFKCNRLCNKHDTRRKMYSLTPDQFFKLMESDCYICGSRENLHIDHDHSCCPTEKSCGECVRGVLCRGCNHGLGNFSDDPERLQRAIEYLSVNGK